MTTPIRRLLATAFCVAAATVSCGNRPEPPTPKPYEGGLPKNAVQIKSVPALYAEYFGQVRECVGSSRVEFEDIRWYVVLHTGQDGFHWVDVFGREWMVAGLAYSQKTAIVMGDRWLFSAEHLRHEMLHLIASPHTHDAHLYQRKCAHLVACYSNCLSDTL